MNIIYSVCSWGLGHATRSLPVIRKLIDENNNLSIISDGRALSLLKNEIDDSVKFISIPDYPMLLSENQRQFIAKSMIYWPLFIHRMQSGLNQLKKILMDQACDLIISDGRYDMYSRSIPSYFISHQMKIMNPLRIKILERGSETFNTFFFKRFKGVIIPDYKTDSLSGDLSHNLKKIDENKLNYVGVLSDFSKKKLKKDIDYLISLSGPEPQRSILEQKMLSQVNQLEGNIVMTLGKTEQIGKINNDTVKIYSYLSKKEREELLNRSKLVISRSGYSTIMDLAVIGIKTYMIPTPGQIEQEYLAEYLHKKGICYTTTQDEINLKKSVKKALKSTGFKGSYSVKDSVENIMNVINN
jgi:uncharacterized protein (TIGR00661 family)